MTTYTIRTRGVDYQAKSRVDIFKLIDHGDLDEDSVARTEDHAEWQSVSSFPDLDAALQDTRAWTKRREQSGFLNLAGLASFLAAFSILVFQVFNFLRDGRWTAMPLLKYVMSLAADTSLAMWLQNPQSWFGLRDVSVWILQNVSLAGFFAFVGLVLGGFSSALEPDSQEWHSRFKAACDADRTALESSGLARPQHLNAGCALISVCIGYS